MNKINLKHICEIRVRYAETDKMGFVYNGNYLIYFEVARSEFMRHFGITYAELEKTGFQLPLIESHIKYIKPAYYDDILIIHGLIEWNGEPKLKFNYEVYVGNILITTGYTKHAFLDVNTGMPKRPPAVFKEAIINAFNKLNKK